MDDVGLMQRHLAGLELDVFGAGIVRVETVRQDVVLDRRRFVRLNSVAMRSGDRAHATARARAVADGHPRADRRRRFPARIFIILVPTDTRWVVRMLA